MSASKTSNKLIMDETALEELGLHGETIYVVEYDMPSRFPLTKEQKKAMNKEQLLAYERFKKLARIFRNRLIFALKFNLDATKHLESNWLIDGDKLDSAVSSIETIKADMKVKGRGIKEFEEVDQRIKIIPIFTTNEGFEHYEDKKAEFVLEFLMEHVKYAEEGIKSQRMAQAILWRSKKAVEICNAHAEKLKKNERYNEIIDTINMLDELNGQCEAFILEQKEDAKAKKEAQKEKKDQ
jgi:hypothetical protein